MAESAAKRVKTSSSALIGTHSGHFHADEALAVHLLRMLPAYNASPLVRTRDPKLLETCHTVVDVGGEYDASRNRYDHHQRGFTTTFPGKATKLSSAGLVFMHFGKPIIAQKLGGVAEDDAQVALIWNKMYESFVEALDAHDNGIAVYEPSSVAGLDKKFSEGSFTLGAMVGRFNPNWNDPVLESGDKEAVQKKEDERFALASTRIGEEFERALDYYTSAWLPARSVVQAAFAKRSEFDSEGRLLVLEGLSAPWKDHLYTLEEESNIKGQVLYVLYPEDRSPGAKWRIQCVPETKDSFQSRKPLPEAWRGFRDEELDGVSGIQGCVFVHAAGFIGGNKTFDGAKEMAAKALA